MWVVCVIFLLYSHFWSAFFHILPSLFLFRLLEPEPVPPLFSSLPPLGRRPYPQWKPPGFRPPNDVLVGTGIEVRGVIRSCRVVDEADSFDKGINGDDGGDFDGGHKVVASRNPPKVVSFWVFPSAPFAAEIETNLQQQMEEYCHSASKSCLKDGVDGLTLQGQAVFVKDREYDKW